MKIFFLVLLLLFVSSTKQETKLDFLEFSEADFRLFGDAHIRSGTLALTKEADDREEVSSSGAILYSKPYNFFNEFTNSAKSWSTMFDFVVDSMIGSTFGDGMTYLITRCNYTLGSSGDYLGLVDSLDLSKNYFIAVEFDTKRSVQFNDPDDNHVGLDINSLISIKTTNVMSYSVNIKSGEVIRAWVDYYSELKMLKVFISYSIQKPKEAALHVDIDLSRFLKEPMCVGFSASSESGSEFHFIERWTLDIIEMQIDRPNMSTQLHPSHASNHRNGLVVGEIVSLGLLIVVLVVVLIKSRSSKKVVRMYELGINLGNAKGPNEFTFAEIDIATKHFNQSMVLGIGAYYRGHQLGYGFEGAIKRLKVREENLFELVSELKKLEQFNHTNLVKLQGWCLEKEEVFLVYKLLPNGSLDQNLHHNKSGKMLNWAERLHIASGIASAIEYLHFECGRCHGNVKTSNIMIDEHGKAMLGDFGLVSLIGRNRTSVSDFTMEKDYRNFGIVLLELLTGRCENSIAWAQGLVDKGRFIEAADPNLKGNFFGFDMHILLLSAVNCSLGRPGRNVFNLLRDLSSRICLSSEDVCDSTPSMYHST